jgi:hypothetical protein
VSERVSNPLVEQIGVHVQVGLGGEHGRGAGGRGLVTEEVHVE